MIWAARRRGSSAARGVRAARSPAEFARATGRMVLWCLVGVLLLRGAGDVLATSPAREPVRPVHRSAAVSWPDDQARAFAARFARAYLDYSPRRSPGDIGELLGFVAPELAESVAPQVAKRDSRRVVQDAVVAGVERLDQRHALVTVAATLAAGTGVSTRFLVVPVARDDRGGLVVYDLPAFAASPALGQVEAAEYEPLTGADAAPVEDVLVRFFRAVPGGALRRAGVPRAGRSADRRAGRPVELVGVDSIAALEPARQDGRLVLATVRARDPGSGRCTRCAIGCAGARGPLVRGGSQTTRRGGERVRKVTVAVFVTMAGWLLLAGSAVAAGEGERVGREPRRPAGRLGEEPVSRDRRAGGAGVPAEPAVRGSGGVLRRRDGGGRVRDGAERHRGAVRDIWHTITA